MRKVLPGLLFAGTVCALLPSACDLIGHPDYECGDVIECKADWLSNTGNYGILGEYDTSAISGTMIFSSDGATVYPIHPDTCSP